MAAEAGRILAVDPGRVRIGLAISDPTRIIASPLEVIHHQSRQKDALEILRIAKEQKVNLIVIGQPLHWDGRQSHQGRLSLKLAEEIRDQGDIPVELVDEYGSTQEAQETYRKMNRSRDKRSGHLDEVAAAIILQKYLESLDKGKKG